MCTCRIYACLSLLTSSCPPMNWYALALYMNCIFEQRSRTIGIPLHCGIYSRPCTLRPAFPTKLLQSELQLWGPAASLSQIESQILLGRGNREAQDEWMARLCHVSVCWWMVRPQRAASGRAARSRVFRTSRYSAVILVLNVIFQKSPKLPVGFSLVWIKAKQLSF